MRHLRVAELAARQWCEAAMSGLRPSALMSRWGVWPTDGRASEGKDLMLYYVAITWLVVGLIFDAVTVSADEGFDLMPPLHQAVISFAAITGWPITLAVIRFNHWRNGGF